MRERAAEGAWRIGREHVARDEAARHEPSHVELPTIDRGKSRRLGEVTIDGRERAEALGSAVETDDVDAQADTFRGRVEKSMRNAALASRGFLISVAWDSTLAFTEGRERRIVATI